MRETQIYGLTREAQKFLLDNKKVVLVKCACPDCKTEHIRQCVSKIYASAKSKGMFDDGPELYEYELKDNIKAREIVQTVIWSSGPCIFLCLEINGKQEFKWSEEEISKA